MQGLKETSHRCDGRGGFYGGDAEFSEGAEIGYHADLRREIKANSS